MQQPLFASRSKVLFLAVELPETALLFLLSTVCPLLHCLASARQEGEEEK